MKMILNIKLLFVFTILLISCEDKILDLEPVSSPTDVSFFRDANQIQLAINDMHSNLLLVADQVPFELQIEHFLTDNGTWRATSGFDGILALSNSAQTSNSGFERIYAHYYKGIGMANNLLQNMVRAKEKVSEDQYNDFRAQALFFRAYFYHYLITYFGDVPFIDVLPKTPIGGFINRTSKTEIVDKLLSDLDEAASKINSGLKGMQERVTLTTILGLKARIALYTNKFEIAADAADAALAAAENQGISLHPNYEELFTSAGENSPEILLKIPYDEQWGRGHGIPRKLGFRFGSLFSQGLPVQNLVDVYPTINGIPIDEDPNYDPSNPWNNRDPRMRASILFPQDVFAGYVYESHRDSLKTFKIVEGEKQRISNTNSRSVVWPAGLTGYVWKKYVDENAVENNNIEAYNDFALMRLGELYLIKAEAEIESNGNLQEAAEALNMLRARAWGGQNYPEIQASSQAELRTILRIERRVELAIEGFRYIDMLRWKIAEKVRNEPLIGRILDVKGATESSIPNIDNDGVVTYPDRSEYDDWRSLNVKGNIVPDGYDSRLYVNWSNAVNRNFTAPKDYLMPIPQTEIDLYKSNGLEIKQNPGY